MSLTRTDILFTKSLRERNERLSTGLFVAEGDKAIGELLETRLTLDTLYTTQRSILVNGEMIGEKDMSRISAMKSAAASLAIFHIPKIPDNTRPGLKLALDGVQDPGNLGTIIRIADWFGVGQIFCSYDSADCWAPKVVQSSMGAVGRVEVNYCNLAKTLAATGETVYGTFLEGGQNIYNAALQNNGWLVLGSEGKGISEEVAEVVGQRIFIPNYGGANVESLNVGVACGIAVSEFRRSTSR